MEKISLSCHLKNLCYGLLVGEEQDSAVGTVYVTCLDVCPVAVRVLSMVESFGKFWVHLDNCAVDI